MAAVLAGGCADDDVGSTGTRDGWTKIEPGGQTSCARGGRFAFWARRGTANKLVVYFQPGGGCFDARTCAPGSSWFDDSVGDGDSPEGQDGVFDLANPANPFRDWSWVYIPSCTGDVHIGDNVRTYEGEGDDVTIRHKGFANAQAALAWTFDHFERPEVVFVTGCSAGSVGSAFHAPWIIERYPKAQIAQLGDSLAFVFHRPIDLQADYRAHDNFPPWIRSLRAIRTGEFTMARFESAVARHYPDVVFSQFNYASDDVQKRFYEAVGGEPDDFERALAANLRELHRGARNFRAFTACGDEHCVLPAERFYTLGTDGSRLWDWVAALARGKDVRCPSC